VQAKQRLHVCRLPSAQVRQQPATDRQRPGAVIMTIRNIIFITVWVCILSAAIIAAGYGL
jgi:hypothetical protein